MNSPAVRMSPLAAASTVMSAATPASVSRAFLGASGSNAADHDLAAVIDSDALELPSAFLPWRMRPSLLA
ncbi:MAG: hypothetical protein R2939_19730 [Kofleriaceae bacterium]